VRVTGGTIVIHYTDMPSRAKRIREAGSTERYIFCLVKCHKGGLYFVFGFSYLALAEPWLTLITPKKKHLS